MRPRAHPFERTKLADRASAFLGKAWAKGWLPAVSLNPDDLWGIVAKSFGDKAALFETAGRSDEDVADFRQRLSKLTHTVEHEAQLNPLGRAMAYGQLSRAIKQRLQFGQLWADHPALPKTEIAAPIIVIGHMRSGTTRIHRLLAADPAHSATRFCDSWHPVPSRFDARLLRGGLNLTIARWLNPWIDALHPMRSGRVEEELGWLACALNHSTYETQWRVPSFSAFSEARDAAPVYREFARILRTDAAHRRIAAKPRVMKVPQFSEDLAAVLTQFPNARLVIAQRESEDILNSAVSVVANQMTIQSDTCDLDWITAECQRKLALRDLRMQSALPGWNGRAAQLQFDALNADWESAMEVAYSELDLEFSQPARAAMQREIAASEGSDHHSHADQIERFAPRSSAR
ncbi:MAG: sulfotransferase [Erythrobacter sp.]